jgi:hypothetical protein
VKSQWMTYRSKRLLYIDLSNFRENIKGFEAELTETVATLGPEMYTQPPHSVLVLVDLRNTQITQQALQILSGIITDTRQYVLRTAVVGMTGIRKISLDFFSRLAGSATGSFDEPEAARQWLVETD